MSLPPPPPSNRKNTPKLPTAPGVGSSVSGATRRTIREEDITPASPLPIVFSSISIVLSAILLIVFHTKSWIIALVGYLLTPFLSILLTGIDAILQRKGTATAEYFLPKPKFGTVLKVLSVISLIVAYFHINTLADFLAVEIAKVWPF